MREGGQSESRESLQDELADTETLIQQNPEANSEERPGIGQSNTARYNRRKGIRIIVISCTVFAVAVTAALVFDIYLGDHHTGHAAVASDVKECSDIGLQLMKKGGSAVDAAIGALLCTGVMNPESSGIGGGGFMLIVAPRQAGEVIDFREIAPGAASKNMFNGSAEMAKLGGLSVGIPGELRGFEIAHKKYGKLKWSEVVEPAIKLAREGFQVSSHTAKVLGIPDVQNNIRKLSPRLFRMLAPKGTFVKKGDRISNPELADTLQQIANQGADAFYSGDIADSIVKAIKVSNSVGIITTADLKNYKALEKKGINSSYQGYQLMTAPLPASGLVLISAMNILERFNLSKSDQGKNDTYQYFIEAFKFAYAQRSRLGDPHDASNKGLRILTEAMMSKRQAAKIQKKIFTNQTFPSSHYAPFFDVEPTRGTAHVSIVGPDGELVSVTSTINGYFGSYVMTETGIILNNQMDDFSSPGITNEFGVRPSKANFIKPGKRPLSSMVPVVIRHKQDPCVYRMAIGASGGTRITTAVIQTLVNILSFGNSLEEAVERPRVHHQLFPNVVEAEGDRFAKFHDSHVIPYLRHVGHQVNTTGIPPADVNVAENFHSNIRVYSDSRRGGSGSSQY